MKRFFYGIGHCMVDYFAQNVEQNIFEAIKKTSPMHLEGNDFSKIFSQISPQTKRLGGTSINILKKLASLGEKCLFSGSTGTFNQNEDDNALFIKSELSKQEIEFQIFSRENSTGQFLTVYNSDCEKAVVVSVGAAKEIEVAQVNEIRFAHCSCFIMEGMQFMNQQVLEQIVDFAFRYNILLVIDCGTVFGAEAVAKRLEDIGSSLDIVLFANEGEGDALKQRLENPEAHCALYVEKHGENGATAYFNGEKLEQPAYPVKKLEKENGNCMEDTGAGDVFAGSFLYKFFKEQSGYELKFDKEIVKQAMDFAALEASKHIENFSFE